MDKFELNHAVTLFTQETTTINSLWTVYVAATFAAAGYGFSYSPLQSQIALAVTIGFLAFAVGNWKLLKQGLTINQQLQKDISKFLACKASEDPFRPSIENPFRLSIEKLIATANPTWISRLIHLLIDGCVVIAIWSRVDRSRTSVCLALPDQSDKHLAEPLAGAARPIIHFVCGFQ